MRREGSQESISHSFTTKLQYEMSTGGGRAPRAKRAFFIILFKNIIRNAYWRGNGAQRAFLIFYFCKKGASSNVRMEAAMGNRGRRARDKRAFL